MGNSIKDFVKNPKLLFLTFGHRGLFNWMCDETYLKIAFYARMHKKLIIKNPQTFNEKLQWLKLHDRRPEYTRMVDKYEVKNYVAERIGEKYIVPTLGVWNNFEDIDFDMLPNHFVLKCTHDSGGLVICKNKRNLDIRAARKKLNSSMKHNFFWGMREWPYKNVKPRIFAEEYLADESGYGLMDYKLMCFNGKVKCSFVCSNRYADTGLCVNFYDKDWNPMPFERHYQRNMTEIEMPEHYRQMVEFAEKLSNGISFLRVDFYESNHKLYFGELTFYPGSGMEEFRPEEWDYELGNWIELT